MYEELRERNLINKHFFGPFYTTVDEQELVTFRESAEKFLSKVEGYRSKKLYKHSTCTGGVVHLF